MVIRKTYLGNARLGSSELGIVGVGLCVVLFVPTLLVRCDLN
jgi:hypothetical protein